jgi:hypothetical protein
MASGNLPTVSSYAVADGTFTARGTGRGKDLSVRGGQVRAAGFPLYWRPEDDHFLSPMELETPAGVLAVAGPKQSLRLTPATGKSAWGGNPFQEIAAVAVTGNVVLVTGVDRPNKKDPDRAEAAVLALSLADGKVMWKQPLPAPPTLWGLAVDRAGRIVVTLTDGRVVCFAAK